MFEKFTEKAIKAIMLNAEKARIFGQNFVGSKQIVLELIGERTRVASKILKLLVIILKDSRTPVDKIIGIGSGFAAYEIPFSPMAKLVLESSLEEALQQGHNYIGIFKFIST